MEQTSFEEKMAHVEWIAEQAHYAEMTLPQRGRCIVDDETAIIDQEYFNGLLEYSCSLPTGTYVGKRWKRDMNANAPHMKCSLCGAMFTGWGVDGQPCIKQGCDGNIHFIEVPKNWYMGEYYDINSKTEIGIRWRRIILVS